MADKNLRERLKAIRSEKTTTKATPPTTSDKDQDLFDRLKALNPATSITKQMLPPANKLDEQQEIDNLIRQTQDQIEIEGDSAEMYDSDVPSNTESIGAIEREAADIIAMAHDEVCLEREMGTIPSIDEDEVKSSGNVISHGDLEDELADATKDADYSIETPRIGSKPFTRPRWSSRGTLFVVISIIVMFSICSVPGAYAFGAGNIPSFAYLEGKAFRHGDIDDVLAELAKKSGGMLFGSSKFGRLDIKRINFGSWLRDYSQAMDVAALQRMTKQAIMNIVMVLGFLAYGYATGEFEVTSDRLGVYLPEEHLDNPKGYAEGKDARQYDNRLRGPVDPQELEIDPRSGMKNYLANENGRWPTGSALIRRTLKQVIDQGRRARQSGNSNDLYEAYRLLGQALHTLEDLPAHSNWCELALHRLGHRNVFLHVGDHVTVTAPDGQRVAPLVTGTFGSADFIHSLLGEAQDHLSEASISDLNKAIDDAKAKSSGNNRSPVQSVLSLLSSVPGGGGDNVSRDLEEVSRGPASDPATMSPQEMYKNLWRILELRDRIMKSIENTIEKIPGLSSLVEKLTNELNIFVFTLIEPYAKPIMQQGMNALHLGSGAVINNEDQFEVFNNPNASDPTHSMLSKDHFGLILNEVAGNVAKIIVRHTVRLVVKAWDDNGIDSERTADECLAPMFHPYWFSGKSQVQKEMMDYISSWAQSHPNEIRRLDKNNVKNHTNTRSGKAEPHSHGGDQPSIASFMGGSSSQAAHNFMPPFNHVHHNNQGGGFGSQMAGATSKYISGQVHGLANQAFEGGHGGGRFREAGGEHHGENSSYYNDGEDRRQVSGGRNDDRRYGGGLDEDKRQGSGYGGGAMQMPEEDRRHGGGYSGGLDDDRRHGSGYGGGGIQMSDEKRYNASSGGEYPGQGGAHYGEGYAPPMPFAQPTTYGDPPTQYGQPPHGPPFGGPGYDNNYRGDGGY